MKLRLTQEISMLITKHWVRVIDNISHHLPDNQAKIVYETESAQKSTELEHPAQFGLEYLDDAETYEPEFNEPKYIASNQIKSKLRNFGNK